MIEKMKKLSLLIFHGARESFLSKLQEIGVVHLETNSAVQSEEITALKDKVVHLKRTEHLLHYLEIKEDKEIIPESYSGDIQKLVDDVTEENSTLEHYYAELDELRKDELMLLPWGDFNSDNIIKLNEAGLNLKFLMMSKAKFAKIEKDFAYEVVHEEKGFVYFVVFYQGHWENEMGALELNVPLKSLKELQAEIERQEQKIEMHKEKMFMFKRYIGSLQEAVTYYEDRLAYSITDASLTPAVEDKVLVVSGWIPMKSLDEVKSFLDSQEIAYVLEEAGAEDKVPVKLKNGPVSRLFEPIGKMYSLPEYCELDPTPFFAPFFALFFGLCIADVGYGLVLLLLTTVGFFAVKSKVIKPFLLLGIILSVMTIGSGVILNTFFGANIKDLAYMPAILKRWAIFAKMEDAMAFAVMLGVLQTMFGFILQVVNKVRVDGIQGAFQPLGTFMILVGGVMAAFGGMQGEQLAIGPIPVEAAIDSIPNVFNIGLVLLAIGVVLVLLFNSLDKKIYIRPALGLWEMYGIVTGVPGDILSYIRLFALGLAGARLGSAFNDIGFMILGDDPNVLNYIFMVLVMLVGHTMNLALAGLSAFVHPLRLILLEFYKSLGFTGGGLAYTPFKNKLIKNK